MLIGASLSEPHTSREHGDFVYIYIYVVSQGKRATLMKLDEYELLKPLHSSYYKDHFRIFAVQIAYSSAEIKLR